MATKVSKIEKNIDGCKVFAETKFLATFQRAAVTCGDYESVAES